MSVPFNIQTRAGTRSRTDYYSPGVYRGRTYLVYEPLWSEEGPCGGHDLAPMTHYGQRADGLYCHLCCGASTGRPCFCGFGDDDGSAANGGAKEGTT